MFIYILSSCQFLVKYISPSHSYSQATRNNSQRVSLEDQTRIMPQVICFSYFTWFFIISFDLMYHFQNSFIMFLRRYLQAVGDVSSPCTSVAVRSKGCLEEDRAWLLFWGGRERRISSLSQGLLSPLYDARCILKSLSLCVCSLIHPLNTNQKIINLITYLMVQ